MTEKIRLLMVDDYPVVLSGLVAMFKNHEEIEVIGVANNGKKAIDLATTMHPHVILMNVAMPGMDGITLIREVKKLPSCRFMPVLVMTTESQQAKRTEARTAGATGWLVKPVKPEELLEVLKKLLP